MALMDRVDLVEMRSRRAMQSTSSIQSLVFLLAVQLDDQLFIDRQIDIFPFR